MDVYYPCLNSCKKCKDEFTCDDCYNLYFYPQIMIVVFKIVVIAMLKIKQVSKLGNVLTAKQDIL